jgi:dipeptidyl aminopeptidase/acylaminoacyl peptidase
MAQMRTRRDRPNPGEYRVLRKLGAADTQPDWSPDGTTIVYHSGRQDSGVYLVPALGGQERQLASFGTYPKWSPDGSEIFIMAGTSVGEQAGNIKFYAVPPDAGPPVPVRAEFLDQGGWYWVATHPMDASRRSAVITSMGWAEHAISRWSEDSMFLPDFWMPDGRTLLVNS